MNQLNLPQPKEGTANPRWRARLGSVFGMAFALIGLIILFGVLTDHFLSMGNVRTIANQIPALLIVSVGMTFVLISGGIDLSVGSVLALSSGVMGVALARYSVPLFPALLLAVCAGLLCGMMNGIIVAWWRLPSFIVTLGMLEAARGAAYLVTDSQTQYIGLKIERVAEAGVAGISVPFLVALLVVISGHVILTKTVLGRHLVATGYREEVAHYSGVKTRGIHFFVFSLAGALTGLAAIMHTARLSAVDPNAGLGLELEAIAAVVIGGTSLAGGRGSVLRTTFGVLIIAVLGNGLAQVGAQEPTKRLITGLVIVAAVILDHYRKD